MVPQGSTAQLEDGVDLLLNWQDEIGLLDYDVSPQSASSGETISVTLTYRALQDLDVDYTAYIHLLDRQGVLAGQADAEPCGGALRTGTWRSGDTIRDTVQLHIAEGMPPGSYQLLTGFYTWPDITPLALEGQEPGYLTTLEIR